MVVLNPPVWMQDGAYTAEHDRLVTGMLVDRNMTKAGALTGIEGGVVPPWDQMRVTANGNMTISVSGGIAVIPRPVNSTPGVYICYNQGTSYVYPEPAVGSGNRVDLIVARVNDVVTGSTKSSWILAVKKGVPSTSNPKPPAPAANEIPLANVLLYGPLGPQAASSGKIIGNQVTDRRTMISGLGGIHVKWGNPMPPHSVGRTVWDAANSKMSVSDGSGWTELMTEKSMSDYFAKYPPKQATLGNENFVVSHVQYSGGKANSSTLLRPTAPVIVQAPEVWVSTPSGTIELSLNSWGRLVQTSGVTRVTGNIIYVGWEARKVANGPVIASNNGTRGPAFSSHSWTANSTTQLLETFPKNILINIKMTFAISNSTTSFGQISNPLILARPIY